MDGFISRLDIANGRISELDDMSIESSQTEKEKDWKNTHRKRILNNCGALQKVILHVIESQKLKKGVEEIFETILTANFSRLMSGTKPQVQEAHVY